MSTRIITLLLFSVSVLMTYAGDIVPTAMCELPMDMTGQTSHVKDKMGRPCALIKVNIPYEGASFDGVIKWEERPGVYFVWIEDGMKRMMVMFPNCTPKMVEFGEFMETSRVIAPRTYQLDFDKDALGYVSAADFGKQYASFKLEPLPDSQASLRVGDLSTAFDTEGNASVLLPFGTYDYTISAPGYADQYGQVEVVADSIATITVTLRSTRGALSITCPTANASISVNGEVKSNNSNWMGMLFAGTYLIEVQAPSYSKFSVEVQVQPEQISTLNIPALAPLYGSMEVQVTPYGSAVKVDGQEKGTTPLVLVHLPVGHHTIEVSHPGYQTLSSTVTIAEGRDNPTLTASLTSEQDPAAYRKPTTKGKGGKGKDKNNTTASLPKVKNSDRSSLTPPFGSIEQAEAGDATSQFWVGFCYCDNTHGVQNDFTEAARWFQAAAERGHAAAQSFLGRFYLQGDGVPRDTDKAEYWLKEAAGKRDQKAQYFLGVLYKEQGNTKDARKWLYEATKGTDAKYKKLAQEQLNGLK